MLTLSPTFIPRSWKAAAVREREREKGIEAAIAIPLIEPPWKRRAPSTQKLFLRDFNPAFRLLDATTLPARVFTLLEVLSIRERKIFTVRSFVRASLFPHITRYFRCHASQSDDEESKHPYISIHLTTVDVALCASFFIIAFPIIHSPYRIAFYSRRLGTRTDFCINECIKDYRHDIIIALACRPYLYTAARCVRCARVRIFSQIWFSTSITGDTPRERWRNGEV